MPFDSQGNFTRVMNWQEDAANSIPILASRHDDEDDNFANGFNEVMCRDGRTQMTGQLKMGSNKIVGLATGTADTDAVNKGQLDSALAGAVAGKQNTITGGASSITSSNLTTNRALISNGSGKVAVSAITSTELGYLDNATGNIQTQINSKQATITGAATTIASDNLTASRALVSNSSGKIGVSSTTSTELGYVHGVTSNIQTQLNNRPTSTDVNNILKALYPIGAIYIGTQTTCPLSTLISGSTWTLVSSGKALWTGDGTNGNTTINAGLPNVTGYFDYAIGSYHDVGLKGKSGAFTNSTATRTVSSYRGYDDSVDSVTKAARVEFDASSSNAIYGGSSTVQPPAYVVNVWRRTA